MATISTHLRNFKEPSRDQAQRLFFSIPLQLSFEDASTTDHKFEINAVLMLNEGQEDSYVSFRWKGPSIYC
jgi:hypothetical protein